MGIILLGLFSCETISDDPVFDVVPRIRLMDISKDTIIQFKDSVSLTLSYEDGDGDLGNPDSDVNALFVKDKRLEEPDAYYLAPLAPIGSSVSIRGTLELHLSNMFLLGNGSQETTELSIYLLDRAGNQSNTVQTGPLLIVKE